MDDQNTIPGVCEFAGLTAPMEYAEFVFEGGEYYSICNFTPSIPAVDSATPFDLILYPTPGDTERIDKIYAVRNSQEITNPVSVLESYIAHSCSFAGGC